MSEISIRAEQPADIEEVTLVTEQALRDHPHGDQIQHRIVIALRKAGALSVSLVVARNTHAVGHIAFSPVRISDGSMHWYGLGPIAVLPERQGQGVGTALIESGLAALRGFGAADCVVLGEPGYYRRFGFINRSECVFEGVPHEYFRMLAFARQPATGTVTCHAAFNAKG